MKPRIRIGSVLCEREGRRTLEGRSQCRWFGLLAEGTDRKQREQAQRGEQAYEECGKKRQPLRGDCAVAVGNEQSDDSDHNGCDRYPEPGPLLSKYVHGRCAEYSNEEF